MPTVLRREATFWRSLWHASPKLTVACSLLVALSAIAFLTGILSTAQFIAAVAHREAADVWRWFALTIVALILQPIAVNALSACSAAHQAAVTADQHARLAALANAPHGIAHLEDPARSGPLTGLLDELRGNFGLWSIGEAWRSLQVRSTGLMSLAVLARWSVLATAALLVVQLVMARTFGAYVHQVQRDLLELRETDGRRAKYLAQLLTRRPPGKEVRLFGLTEWCLAQYQSAWRTAQLGVTARRNRALRPVLASGLVMIAVSVGAAVWLIRDAWVGAVGTATLTATLQALIGMRAFGPLGDTSTQAARSRTYAERLAALETAAPADHPAAQPAAPPAAHPVAATPVAGRAASIELSDISFTYPSRNTPVFQRLSLTIPAGQSVAIVGVNGVGKSTLIKLLAGLYPPDSGTVRVGGKDPFTDDATRRQVAVIFQDFVRYHLSLRDNVLLPVDESIATDNVAIDRIASGALRSAAAEDVLHRVGDWDVTLDPGYSGGTDLSGGQWQRVALARAFAAVAAGAGVLVLDEPTAALDVRVESEIFERFLESTRGVTSILVSHRLSSVRHAERIVVLGPDGVVEDGSHEDLLAAGGDYAQLFTLQATRFQQADATTEDAR
ncbi:ABC transporter ATP-binding protein [Calidifontibacter sp. DB0510]|uniref:ABC transporter ATP-binding protein n=1 Tax=Metallococcus carri TaxID=1656884 RepID=A0A967AXP0_9MICO|nr:ABC transporter ATP-binding protein [Metallococcus carri]NHN54638.1 ABC transporter ATP-binding protein [Metallococcus carri]NOP36523.1 ABC transporter ATP-binding protein [Calidifontibacter sp. DB2511S]